MSLEQSIREELQNPLPGIEYHRRMMALHNPSLNTFSEKNIQAAVALIIYSPQKNYNEIVLIKRTSYDGHHSDQVSFPGGKFDGIDSTLVQTAIRETYEEIGINLKESEFLGTLTPIHIHVSGFDVTPFVFFYHNMINPKVNNEEVSYLIRCSLTSLFDKSIIKTTYLNLNGYEIEAPYFDIKNEIVWGATSMILAEFIEILRRIEKKDPDLLESGFTKNDCL